MRPVVSRQLLNVDRALAFALLDDRQLDLLPVVVELSHLAHRRFLSGRTRSSRSERPACWRTLQRSRGSKSARTIGDGARGQLVDFASNVAICAV
jgi:hypothetical protein